MDEKKISELVRRALETREMAYAPYSKFKVGAAVLADNGEVYTGVNVENSSYGLTNCAERTAIFTAVTNGMKKIIAIAIAADTEEPVSPCGACRQVIYEFSDKDTIIILSNLKGDRMIFGVEEILPYGFKL
jgi:cytidine deaminase